MAATANAMGRPVLAKLKYFNGAIDFLLQTGNSWSESGGRLHGDLARSNTEKTHRKAPVFSAGHIRFATRRGH